MDFNLSSWFGLGEGRLPILLSTTNSSQYRASNSAIGFLFYAKGVEEIDTLQKLLQRKVINLGDLLCPKIEHLSFYRETPICDLHSTTCPKRQKNGHCARKKAQLFFYWLIHEQPSIGKDNTVCTPVEFVSKFEHLKLLSG